jgi:hypothetical protein
MDNITKEELFSKAQERFNSWAKMYSDPNVTVQQMYEDMTCSCYSGDIKLDTEEEHPVLDQDFCFRYRSYAFKLSSCNNITNKEQILGLTNESFKEWFPNGVFTDRYVCWMFGYENCNVYLVPGAWSWGAESDLRVCAEVDPIILEAIDKFLETFKE